MPAKIDLGDEDGLLEVGFGEASVVVDVFKTSNDLLDLHERHKGRPANDYNEALAEYVAGLGLPKPSHRLACRFAKVIRERIDELGKAGSQSAGSPASTGSTPAA